MVSIDFDTNSVDSYKKFLKVRSLPQYRISGSRAFVPDEYAALLVKDALMHWRSRDREWNEIVGLQIYNRRTEKNLTQKELGEMVGVKKHRITQIESGVSPPSAHTLFKIARALCCQMDVFYGPIKRENLVKF